jgi:hypothetical protein
MSMGSTKRLLDELRAPDKPYPETDSKVGLLESGRRPAKWPFIQWLYALTTISGKLALGSRASQVAISNCILAFPQTHINARFLSHIDNFGAPLDERYSILY